MKISSIIFLSTILAISSFAQDTTSLTIGQWRQHLPYSNGPYVTQNDEAVIYATDGGLVQIDKVDRAVTFLGPNDGFSGVNPSLVKWVPGSQVLVVTYENAVIDLRDASGQVRTLNQIANFDAFVGEKVIYDLAVESDSTILIAASFGVSRLNIRKGEFSFTTFTNTDIFAVAFFESQIYAATDEGIFRLPADSAIPENFSNWELLGPELGLEPAYFSSTLAVFQGALYFDQNNDIYSLGDEGVQLILPAEGRQARYLSAGVSQLLAGFLCEGGSCDDQAVFTLGADKEPNLIPPGCLGKVRYGLEDENGRIWLGDEFRGIRVLNRMDDQNCEVITFNAPYSDRNRSLTLANDQLWVASGDVDQVFSYTFLDHGFYSLIDGQWTIYNRNTREELKGEDPISTGDDLYDFLSVAVHPDNGKVYAGSFIEGLIEVDGDLLTLYNEKNSSLNNAVGDPNRTRVSGLAFDQDKNLWISNHFAERPLSVLRADGNWQSFRPSCGETQLHQMAIDPSGFKWIISNSSSTGVVLFDEGELDNNADDRCRIFRTGNSVLPTNQTNCVTVDLNGDVWVGTAEGVIIFECGSAAFDQNCQGTRRIINQDEFDGFLLSDENVQSIAVDGANRKWVGTRNGLFLFSPSGIDQLARFSTADSPLPNNDVRSVAVNNTTGEVFVGTAKGIVSLQYDAVEGGQTHREELEVYPNPVPPDYNGPIAIRGLARNATVKITDINGRLVFETEALGGQAIWNGQDYNGRRANTGVYLIFSSSDPTVSGFNNPDNATGRIVFIR